MNLAMYKKNYILWPSGIHSRYVSLGQPLKINQCNPSHQQAKEEKSYAYTDIEKAFEKTHPFMKTTLIKLGSEENFPY